MGVWVDEIEGDNDAVDDSGVDDRVGGFEGKSERERADGLMSDGLEEQMGMISTGQETQGGEE
jgi:hypothetical protein